MLRLYFLPLLLLQSTSGFVLPLLRGAAQSLPVRSLAADDDSQQDLDLKPLLDDETPLYLCHRRRQVLRQGIITSAALLLVNAATPLLQQQALTRPP